MANYVGQPFPTLQLTRSALPVSLVGSAPKESE
jgi:hypothetical protein